MSSCKDIEGIFFDLGGTLCRPATGHWTVPIKALELLGSNSLSLFETEQAKKAFSQCVLLLDENQLLKNENEELLLFKSYYAMLFEQLQIPLTRQQLEEIAYDKVFNTYNFVFLDDAFNTVKLLSEKYRLGVLSDTWPSTTSALKRAGLYDMFDNITYSCDVGVCKPDKKIYAKALETMRLSAHKTLFIDDVEKNLDGAAAFGIHTLLILNGKKASGSEKHQTIGTPSDLVAFLGCV